MRIKLLQRGLLQIVDGRVFQHVAGQVVANLAHDLVAELVAGLVQIDKIHGLADGLQRFGELGREQILQRVLVAGAGAADGLGHPQHVLGGLVDAHEELDLDVGAHVVPADQALLAHALDLDGLHRDVHLFDLVQHRDHQPPGKSHLGLHPHGVDDHGVTLLHLAVELGDQRQESEQENHQHNDAGNQYEDGLVHGLLRWGWD